MSRILPTAIQPPLAAAIFAVLVGCAHQTPTPQPENWAKPEAQPALMTESASASDILQRMANVLAKAPKFTVNIDDQYDTIQASGQKLEFSSQRTITVSRPNGLKVEHVDSHGEKQVVYYDGQDITVFNPKANVYAQTSKAGGIDAAVKYFLKDLNMKLPLALLLVSQLPNELEQRTQVLDYVEQTTLNGQPVHHLAGQTDTVDYQVWVTLGSQPLPLRVVLTYKHAEGQPQFRAQLSDWNLTPAIDDSGFSFAPPEGAKKIAFLAHIPSLVPGAAENPVHPGE